MKTMIFVTIGFLFTIIPFVEAGGEVGSPGLKVCIVPVGGWPCVTLRAGMNGKSV